MTVEAELMALKGAVDYLARVLRGGAMRSESPIGQIGDQGMNQLVCCAEPIIIRRDSAIKRLGTQYQIYYAELIPNLIRCCGSDV